MKEATLEVSRMKDRALYDRGLTLAIQLTDYGRNSLKASDVRAMGAQLQCIVTELRLRGVQLTLGS
jgi:hypothetical protein